MRIIQALLPLALLWPAPGLPAQQVVFPAPDGGEVHATWYPAEGGARAVILAFHQGGASGEAEYAPIAPALNAAGFTVLAVDQRAGGELFGGTNRTAAARGDDPGYCDAMPDLEGALAYARAERPGEPLVLWGSSYSAALVLRLAGAEPEGVAGVLAFSPASGGPLAACRGEEVSGAIDAPVLILRPAGEMERPSAVEQAETFRRQGHRVFVADPGTHGSSMLVEERVGGPTAGTWQVVMAFLEALDG